MRKRALKVIVFVFALTIILLGSGIVMASTVLDSTFKPVFASAGSVVGIAPLPNGRMMIIGSFTTASGTATNNIARINADGTVDTAFNLAADINVVQILAVAVQSNGKILIGGYMTYYEIDKSHSYLFRLNADGTRDTSFDAGGYIYQPSFSYGIDNVVRAIVVQNDGKILIGGDFTTPHNYIARLNTDGSPDTTFDPGTGANGPVTNIAQQSTGKIIIGGTFSKFNGTTKGGIASLSATGILDAMAFGIGVSGFGIGTSTGSLLTLAVQPDDKVVIGGGFTAAAGQSIAKLARFNADGSIDSSFQPIINTIDNSYIGSYLDQITSVTTSGNYIFVGGWNPVMYMNNWPTDHNAAIYVLNIATGSYYSYMNFKGKPTDVWALTKRSDGLVVAGGSFTQRDDYNHEEFYPGLCLLTGQYFQPDATFNPIVGGQANVQTLAIQSDGKIIAGGDFYLVQGISKTGVARLNSDGSLDPTLTPPVTKGGSVTAALARSDGKIIMGGSFYNINNQDYKDVALLSTTGTMEASAYVGGVNALAFQPDGKILAVMPHTPGIRRLNADPTGTDLTFDTSFNPGDGISNSAQPPYYDLDRANAVAVQKDGKILIGGSFSAFSGVSKQNIVRLNSDGSIDTNFTPPAFAVATFRSEVFSIAVQADHKILVSGRFSTVGGVTSPAVARLNANGTIDGTFVSAIPDAGTTASKVYVQNDGKILVGGDIQIWEVEKIYNSFVRLNPNGTRDTSFNTSITGNVKDIIAPPAWDQILVGGTIAAVEGIPRQGLARYLVLRGDVNQDNSLNLADAIIALQVMINTTTQAYSDADVNNDGNIGLAEVIYILQKIAGLR